MQKTMILDDCARCGQPIRPGEPAMQFAAVDIIDGRVVASPTRSYHLKGGCPAAAGEKSIRAAA